MAVTPQYFVILVVDIEKFGIRPNPVQTFLRRSLYELMERALAEAGIDARSGSGPVDRGDGLFLLLPGSVPKTDLVGSFVTRLRTGLRAHAQTANAAAALRLRVVLHSGEVAWDGRGWVGEDLNTACRMVDHQPLRDALAAAGDAGLVLGISDAWHRSVLRHDYPELDAGAFRPVRFDAKEIEDETVWVRVPGYAAPPGLDPDAAPGVHAGAARGVDSGTARGVDSDAARGVDPGASPEVEAGPEQDVEAVEARGVEAVVAGRRAGERVHAAARARHPRHTAAAQDSPAPQQAPHRTPWRPEMTGARPDASSGVSITQTGGTTQQAVGVNEGWVNQQGGGSGGPAPDPALLAHITTLRRGLRDARDRREVDEDTFEGASRALDDATREAAAGPEGRSRFVLALRAFRGLVEPVAALAAAAAGVIAAVRGNGS